MWNILYTSPAITPGGCFESNGLDPQLQVTPVTSMDLPHRAPVEDLQPHTCHQFGYRSFWNYRNERTKWTETYCKELRLHPGSWAGLWYQGCPYQANPSLMLSRKHWGNSGLSLLAHDCWLQHSPLCSPNAAHQYVLCQHRFDNKQIIQKCCLAKSRLLH